MNFHRFKTLFVFLLICSCCFKSTIADEIIDQSSSQGDLPFIVNTNLDQAQTFRVGITGQLTQVELYLRREAMTTSPLLFDVRQLTGSLPSEANNDVNILATATVSAASVSQVDDWQVFDISNAQLNVTAGDSLALTLRSDDAAGYSWLATDSNDYEFGESFLRLPIANWSAQPFTRPIDQSFRTTVAVPEPAIVSPLILGCFLAVRRRRRDAA